MGATFRSTLVLGTASSSGSAAGRFRAFSSVFPTRCPRSSISSACSTTARCSKRTRRRRGQVGDRKAGEWPLPGRPDVQGRGRRGRARMPCAVHDSIRLGARICGGARHSRRSSVRGLRRRQGVRRRLAARRSGGARRGSGDSRVAEPDGAAGARPGRARLAALEENFFAKIEECGRSRRGSTRRTRASRRGSTSSPVWSRQNDCWRTLALCSIR